MNINSIRVFITLLSVVTVFAGCNPEAPRIRVQNQNQNIIDVALKPPSGTTININDVSSTGQTNYIEIPTSQYEVDINIENNNSDITTFFQADEDETYTIIVDNAPTPTVRIIKP